MKRILLAVCGLSPQVITETLYALHQNYQPVDAIHVITTRDGKERIFAQLLSGRSGHYYRYLAEYGIDANSIDFGPDNIHVITDEHGNEIPDIVSESDNERLLGKCLELAFRFTADPATAVFFSIAGGRKTMSACLMVAAQMYGRPQDRVYHVLVSPEFESNRNFFYPPRKSKIIELLDANGQPFFKETKYAEINLVHIPFVSIRDRFSGEYLDSPKDPGTLLLSLIKEEEAKLTVNLLNLKVIYKHLEADLMPARLALYVFFVLQKKNCPKDVSSCGKCRECFMNIQEILGNQGVIADIYGRLRKHYYLGADRVSGIMKLDKENFNSYRSKVNADLRKIFGVHAVKDIGISPIGRRPNTRYGIKLDKSRIEVIY